MKPEPLSGRVAIVTGASSGIGAVTARKLSVKGLKVVLVARREDRLRRLADEISAAGGEAFPVAADLSLEPDRLKVYLAVKEKFGSTDILINNAGLGWYGYACQMPWDTAAQMVRVNAEATVHLTLLYLPEMRARGSGHIINIGSIAGSLPNQGIMVYSATKAFVDAFSTSLYRELRGTNVRVTVIRAGAVATEFNAQAKGRAGGMSVPAESLAVRPERVANCVWRVLKRPRRVAFVPRVLWLAPWLEHYFGWVIDRMGPVLLKRQRTP